MPPTPIQIIFSCDANRKYAMLLRTCIASILKNAAADDEHHFHVLDGGIDEQDKTAIESLREIRSFAVSYYPAGEAQDYDKFHNQGLSNATYYRLRACEIIKDIPRALYLDVDLVALCSLKPLFRTDLNGHAFGACLDAAHDGHAARLGIPVGSYFNAGVMLMDLEKWRKGGIYEKCVAAAQKYGDKITFHDQDILNLIFRDHYCLLPQKWNILAFVINFFARLQKNNKNIARDLQYNIIHFAGSDKLQTPSGAVLTKYAQLAGFSFEEVAQAWAPDFLKKIRPE